MTWLLMIWRRDEPEYQYDSSLDSRGYLRRSARRVKMDLFYIQNYVWLHRIFCSGFISQNDIDGLVQERPNSSALAMELRLSCTNLSICHAVVIACLYTDLFSIIDLLDSNRMGFIIVNTNYGRIWSLADRCGSFCLAIVLGIDMWFQV